MAKDEEKKIEKTVCDCGCGCNCGCNSGKWGQILHGLKFGLGFFAAAIIAFIALVIISSVLVLVLNKF